MPSGLQVWGADGRLILDTSHRCGRVKGFTYANGSAGSYNIDLSDGTPFWSFQPDFLFRHIAGKNPIPTVTVTSTGISWTYSSPDLPGYVYPITGYLFVGVY
ncbi:hypothetical protein WS81_26060 [Burkholderia sp. MSMB2040]|nr:hypothetical protein WS78_26305 [Burkholderia savannae]KVG44269.1 hypothetical protein WS77_10075 [Burkholderia sp. MSMB0265]KVG87797.1 hypothetical protein WS81_26060 [Burkholderia sp. MSMB2040]KVG97198.1 hypothetical protein WS82_30285 [Burkholderia sp. MSMB2041]